ncbi:type II secretion system F family protein [Paenarthrobacter histidinolovorans]|uniref:Tight adherence protein B n=1 Tax=Paenarthrobacter histidinolovorans TaxID=43664 RepID=A0ABW8N4C6_9MICC
MESPGVFILAVTLCMVALFILVAIVLKPRRDSIPIERRRLETSSDTSAVGLVSDTAVRFMDNVLGRSGGPFNREVLYQAGVKQAPADFMVLVVAGAVVTAVVGALVFNLFVGIFLALSVPFLAKLVLVSKTQKRRAKFEVQLTDTIQMLIGGLRVGHGIMRSLQAAAQESQAPTSEELSRIVNEVRVGKDARQAIEDCAARMDSEDFRWIGQAIQINREVGGDLAEVLEQVEGTIRERSEIKGHVRALSAEGKMSAVVLMILPVAVGIFMSALNPGYLKLFTGHPLGIALIVVSVILFAVGGFWMSRTVKIKF